MCVYVCLPVCQSVDKSRKEKKLSTNPGVHTEMLMHIHTHIRKQWLHPSSKSNFGGDEIGDELQWEGARNHCFRLQKPETDCFIIQLQQYHSHTCTQEHTHTYTYTFMREVFHSNKVKLL